ncbi:anaphase-promoting complex subunit 10 [Pelomyxa schiedti]|nr:anaphase-promoting complex subunit 10 [Pelomyxa schiedti]
MRRALSNCGRWWVTSAKQDHGVSSLFDDDPGTFWQSDGSAPHSVFVEFAAPVRVSDVAILVDTNDDNYAPSSVRVHAGPLASAVGSRVAAERTGVAEAVRDSGAAGRGWVVISLATPRAQLQLHAHALLQLQLHMQMQMQLREAQEERSAVGFVFQIELVAMINDGKDARLRGLKLFTPDSEPEPEMGLEMGLQREEEEEELEDAATALAHNSIGNRVTRAQMTPLSPFSSHLTPMSPLRPSGLMGIPPSVLSPSPCGFIQPSTPTTNGTPFLFPNGTTTGPYTSLPHNAQPQQPMYYPASATPTVVPPTSNIQASGIGRDLVSSLLGTSIKGTWTDPGFVVRNQSLR